MTALPASTRYYAPGVTKILFLTTIAAATLAATRAEMTAGTDLSDEVADLAGWNISAEDIATPGLSDFTGSVPGRTSVDASTITFYADELGEDVRTVLTPGLAGFIVIMDAGDIEGGVMDVFPVRVKAVGKPRTVTGQNASQVTVGFSFPRKPKADVAIPAAA